MCRVDDFRKSSTLAELTGVFSSGPEREAQSGKMQYTVSLKLNHVFQRLYRKGTRSALPTLALYSRPNGRGENRLGLTTGAKLGCAVVRNKLRRRLRAIYRIHEAEFRPGFDIVVVCRAAAVTASYRRLEKDLLKLARRNGLLRQAPEDTPGAKARKAGARP